MTKLTFDQRIERLEALLTTSVPGTQISRQMNNEGAFQWCIAIGAMGCPKAFYQGRTMEDALCAAEAELLTPVVPDTRTLRALAKNPSMTLLRVPYVRALLDLTGINLADYAPKPRAPRAPRVVSEAAAR